MTFFACSDSKPHYGYVEESIQKDIHSSDVRIGAMFRFKGLNYYRVRTMAPIEKYVEPVA